MGNKELYELKQNSIKTKYKNEIARISSSDEINDIEFIKKFKEDSLADIKRIRADRQNTLNTFRKRITIVNIIADIILLIGLVVFSLGLYLFLKGKLNSNVWSVLCIVFGVLLVLLSAGGFGYVGYQRELRTKYISDSYSESEIASTKSMIIEFCDSILDKN